MTRFYFDLHECGETLVDEEGIDCTDLAGARNCALRAARDVMAGEIHDGRLCLSCHIEVRDDRGVAVATVMFRDAVAVSG
jgi:hypothetical protein